MNEIKVTPEEAAVYANMGVEAAAIALQQRFGLDHKPGLEEVCAMIGTSIGAEPTSGLSEEQLMALTENMDAPDAADAYERLEVLAAKAHPDDPARQRHWIEANMANRRIARALANFP